MSDQSNAAQELSPGAEAAMKLLQEAFKTLSPEERAAVKDIQSEVDAAAQAGTIADARLEFCYTVKFSGDRISNAKLLRACEAYITAAEG